MVELVCLNGRLLPPSEAVIQVNSLGVMYGYGLFETMRVLEGKPVFLSDHLDRLVTSAREINLTLTRSREEISLLLDKTITANRLRDGSLRLMVTAGPNGAPGVENIAITVRRGIPYPPNSYQEGFRAGFLNMRRNENSPLVRLKTLNFLENILGRQEAGKKGWDEGLFLNNAGYLSEGTVSNVFLVGSGELVTPHVNAGLLPGTVREKVIALAHKLGLRVQERMVRPEEIYTAREAFLTNSLLGVMPLVYLDGGPIGDAKPGPVTLELMAGYNALAAGR